MRIWWCQEHEASADGPDVWNCLREGAGPCRMVPMRLIPDNAETVERISEALLDHAIAQGHMLAKFRSVQRPNTLTEAAAILTVLDGETP